MIRKIAAAVLVLAVSSWPAIAAERTVVLNVDNATCPLCPPIVRMTLERVEGVKAVQVTEADATSPAVATVTFDDALTDVQALITATTNAGYPSQAAN